MKINLNLAKWLGLVGALFAGGSQIFAGDAVNGWGIVAAALSSATVLRKE